MADVLQEAKAFLKGYWMWLLVCLILLRLCFNKYGRSLNSIPGPFVAGFTDLWRFIDTITATPHETHIKLHRQTGSSLVRIGPRTISVSDPALIPKIYGLNSGFTKTKFYTLHMLSYQGQFTPSLFTTLDEGYHAKYKRPIANAYSMSTLVEFEPLIDSTSQLFMSRLDEFVSSQKVFNFGQWLQMYAFDVIGEIVFSRKLGFLETRSDVDGIMADIRTKVFYGGSVGQIPTVDKFITKSPLFLACVPTHPIVNFTVERMRERLSAKAQGVDDKKRDFLTRCFEAQEKNPDLVTDRIIRMYNIDNVLAGSDTTGISLRSIFYYLMKSPQALKKVVDEIDKAESEGSLSEFITWKESNNQPYLQACIKEALRMHPAVGLLLERHVPKGGVTLGDHFLPEGTIVGVNPWVAARNRQVYGEDADNFRPERWLEASPEQLAAMDRASLTFGHGARSCIGKNISMLEITKLVPQLLRHYEVRPNGNMLGGNS
ncbi:uncharacterized protein Z518_01164 [Rhinocladiella mackenziei CBS 650.93]|uniref:Rhinocladiella mackenziei CBS 650.93 unplaced genomic scaffold supercont1.1, whole genome shotgun sequence n=1 Tax=Rhinocladiella mackenziei CBS 650.93 TaxID=1442369 RepID=A0A0D2HHG4_9EURO|nr:uncharacterized protein Z518_01164 [Rhinocladiella mackenziei CBS 650.93]KIX10083.1 hypothetical protein Z518_01164 [Rhinocladiella mackenziei CBS 650.93]